MVSDRKQMTYVDCMKHICAKCFELKEIHEFPPALFKSQPDSVWCNVCWNSYKISLRARWKAEGKCVNCGHINERFPKTLCGKCAESQNKRTKSIQIKIKVYTFNAYGGCYCKCCGEQSIVMLTLDHINNKGAEHRKQLRGGKGEAGGGGNKTYYALKKAGYPSGYRVLCFNCNHAIYVLGYCPHELEPSVKNPLLLVSNC